MYVCMHACIYLYVAARFIHIQMYACMYVYRFSGTLSCLLFISSVCMYTYVCMYVCIHIDLAALFLVRCFFPLYVCMYVYIYLTASSSFYPGRTHLYIRWRTHSSILPSEAQTQQRRRQASDHSFLPDNDKQKNLKSQYLSIFTTFTIYSH